MPAISPSNIEDWQKNAYYKIDREYISPSPTRCTRNTSHRRCWPPGADRRPALVTYYIIHPEASIADCRKWRSAGRSTQYALRDIPPEKNPLHTCYGINMGRASTTWSSRTSSIIILKIAPAPIRSRPPIRATSTNGSVEGVKLPDGKIRSRVSRTRPFWSSHPERPLSASCATTTWSARKRHRRFRFAASPPSPVQGSAS